MKHRRHKILVGGNRCISTGLYVDLSSVLGANQQSPSYGGFFTKLGLFCICHAIEDLQTTNAEESGAAENRGMLQSDGRGKAKRTRAKSVQTLCHHLSEGSERSHFRLSEGPQWREMKKARVS